MHEIHAQQMIKIRHARNNDATKIFYLKNVNNQSILIFFWKIYFLNISELRKTSTRLIGMKDNVETISKHIWFFYVRPEQKLLHFYDAQNLVTLCETGVFFQFLGHKFFISEPLFKICIRNFFCPEKLHSDQISCAILLLRQCHILNIFWSFILLTMSMCESHILLFRGTFF